MTLDVVPSADKTVASCPSTPSGSNPLRVGPPGTTVSQSLSGSSPFFNRRLPTGRVSNFGVVKPHPFVHRHLNSSTNICLPYYFFPFIEFLLSFIQKNYSVFSLSFFTLSSSTLIWSTLQPNLNLHDHAWPPKVSYTYLCLYLYSHLHTHVYVRWSRQMTLSDSHTVGVSLFVWIVDKRWFLGYEEPFSKFWPQPHVPHTQTL